MSQQTLHRPNAHEAQAWRHLVALGARRLELGGKPALDVSAIRVRSAASMAEFVQAFHEVAGRSGAVRRHVDRQGRPVFIVADEDPTT